MTSQHWVPFQRGNTLTTSPPEFLGRRPRPPRRVITSEHHPFGLPRFEFTPRALMQAATGRARSAPNFYRDLHAGYAGLTPYRAYPCGSSYWVTYLAHVDEALGSVVHVSELLVQNLACRF